MYPFSRLVKRPGLEYKKNKPCRKRLVLLLVTVWYEATCEILLYVVVGFMVVDHALANDLHGLEFFEHDDFATLVANAVGKMVELFAVCE